MEKCNLFSSSFSQPHSAGRLLRIDVVCIYVHGYGSRYSCYSNAFEWELLTKLLCLLSIDAPFHFPNIIISYAMKCLYGVLSQCSVFILKACIKGVCKLDERMNKEKERWRNEHPKDSKNQIHPIPFHLPLSPCRTFPYPFHPRKIHWQCCMLTLNYNMCAKLKLENKFFLWFEWKNTIFRKT